MQEYPSSAMTQIPDDVARLAHEQQLGSPQGSLSITRLSKGWRWMDFLPLVSLFLVFISFIALWTNLHFLQNYILFPTILFFVIPDVTNGDTSQTLQSGTTNLMHKGYGVPNQLTLIAIGSLFYIYLNQQLVMKVTDQTLTIGELSLLVDSETAPTEAVFSQAVAWNIAGMAP